MPPLLTGLGKRSHEADGDPTSEHPPRTPSKRHKAECSKESDLANRERLAAVEKMERENAKMGRVNERAQHELMLFYKRHLAEYSEEDDPYLRPEQMDYFEETFYTENTKNMDFYRQLFKGKQMEMLAESSWAACNL